MSAAFILVKNLLQASSRDEKCISEKLANFRFSYKRKDCIVTDGNGNVIYVAHFQ